jgi:hypothetical protein
VRGSTSVAHEVNHIELTHRGKSNGNKSIASDIVS